MQFFYYKIDQRVLYRNARIMGELFLLSIIMRYNLHTINCIHIKGTYNSVSSERCDPVKPLLGLIFLKT